MIEIEIPGKPIALKRARTSKGRFYDPSEKEKNKIRWYIRKQYPGPIITGPISLGATFYFKPPSGISKAKRNLMMEYGVGKRGKPDLDNLVKMILDCGNNLLWEDDSQIFRFYTIKKVYGEKEMTRIFFDEED